MTEERPTALIVYDGLPISAGGAHRLRGRDRSAIWSDALRFLDAFTTYEEPGDVRLLLAEGSHLEHDFFVQARDAARARFGRAQRRLAIAGDLNEYEYAWRIGPGDIDEALVLMQGLEPIPEHLRRGQLVLSIDASFRLCDPDTDRPFPGQDPALYGGQEAAWNLPLGLSRIYLRLTRHSTCALFLSLPFPEVTPALRQYVTRLETALPFRFSRKHWSRWQLNAEKTRYYNRRISAPHAEG